MSSKLPPYLKEPSKLLKKWMKRNGFSPSKPKATKVDGADFKSLTTKGVDPITGNRISFVLYPGYPEGSYGIDSQLAIQNISIDTTDAYIAVDIVNPKSFLTNEAAKIISRTNEIASMGINAYAKQLDAIPGVVDSPYSTWISIPYTDNHIEV